MGEVCIFCGAPAVAQIYKVGPVCDRWMRQSDHYPQSKTTYEKERDEQDKKLEDIIKDYVYEDEGLGGT